LKQANIAIKHVIDRVSLQAANFDGLFTLLMHDTRAFAEHLGRTNAPATFAQNIRFEDDSRRSSNIARHDAFDESGNINPRRTRNRARGVKTIEAARSLDGGLSGIQRRSDVGEILFVLLRRQLWSRLA
jgi:hypothetical protein